jgi:hypothetical protein
MCCVMVCAWVNFDRWRDASASDGGVCARRAGAWLRSPERVIFEPVSGRYDRFATRFATLVGGTVRHRLSYGIGFGFPAIVIDGIMNPGMVDSGAAMAGACAPAKWGGSAGSRSLLNRGGG